MVSTPGGYRFGGVGRWILIILAVLIGSTLLSTLVLLQCAPDTPRPSGSAPLPVDADTTGAVQAEMRNVAYHIDSDIVLHIRYLRGQLLPTSRTRPPVFEDGASYTMAIEAAEIFVDTSDLAGLINRYVFGYRGAPIHELHLSVDGEDLVQKGKLGNLSFTIRSRPSLTPEGEIRLHPVDVKVLGINADGLMRHLGIQLDEMLKVQPDRGIRVVENDFLLDVTAILPPPRIRGTLSAIRLVSGGMVQRFGPIDSVGPRSVLGDSTPARNFMYYLGGIIRFGKLTMTGTDMLIVDADQSDPFGFYLGRYHEQLVAGDHRTTPVDGLIVRMPDLGDLKP